MKREVVSFARSRWRLKFSRHFPVQERHDTANQSSERIRLAINADGVFIVRDDHSVLVECSYQEIVRIERRYHSHRTLVSLTNSTARVCCSQESKESRNDFVVVSLSKGEWRFRSPEAYGICRLVGHFLDGLRDRSRYAMALRNTVEGGE